MLCVLSRRLININHVTLVLFINFFNNCLILYISLYLYIWKFLTLRKSIHIFCRSLLSFNNQSTRTKQQNVVVIFHRVNTEDLWKNSVFNSDMSSANYCNKQRWCWRIQFCYFHYQLTPYSHYWTIPFSNYSPTPTKHFSAAIKQVLRNERYITSVMM